MTTDYDGLRALCEPTSDPVEIMRRRTKALDALPELLEENERLLRLVERKTNYLAGALADQEMISGQRDQLTEEIARLKAELATRPLPTAFTAALARIAELEGEGT